MSIRLKLLGLLLLLTFTCCTSCGEDDEQPCVDAFHPDCPNYDPCLSVLPAQPDNIAILDSVPEAFADIGISFSIDTMGKGGTVYFRPDIIRDDAIYEWKIGTDPRIFTETILDVNFTGFEGDVQVRLVTKITDEFACLEQAEQIDTSYQSFYINYLLIEDFPIIGAYKGATESKPEEEFTLEIYPHQTSTSTVYRLRGFNLDCIEDGNYAPITFNYDSFVTVHLSFDFRCRELTAVGRLRENDHRVLEVDYSYVDDEGKTIEKRFVGYRQ